MLRHSSALWALLGIAVIVLSAGYAWGADDEWPGTMQLPAKGIKTVVFVVNASEGEPSVKGLKYKGEFFEFSEVVWKQSSVTFSWKPGPNDLRCNLVRGDGGLFSGSCPVPGSDEIVQMTLWIPEEEGEERDEDAGGVKDNGEEKQDGVENSDDGIDKFK